MPRYRQTSQCKRTADRVSSSGILSFAFNELAGVFIIIYSSMLTGILFLVFEWIASCRVIIDKKADQRPKTYKEAFLYRWGRLKNDLFLMCSCSSYQNQPDLELDSGSNKGMRFLMIDRKFANANKPKGCMKNLHFVLA